MKKIFACSIIVLASLPFAACRKTEMKTYADKDGTISYPSDWDLNMDPGMGASYMIKAPQESPLDLFQENVNVIIQDLSSQPMDLKAYTDLSVEQVNEMMANSKILENETRNGKNGPYQFMHYTADQTGLHLEFEQYYIIKGNAAYVLTFSAEHSSFSKYKEKGEAILDSYTIK